MSKTYFFYAAFVGLLAIPLFVPLDLRLKLFVICLELVSFFCAYEIERMLALDEWSPSRIPSFSKYAAVFFGFAVYVVCGFFRLHFAFFLLGGSLCLLSTVCKTKLCRYEKIKLAEIIGAFIFYAFVFWLFFFWRG